MGDGKWEMEWKRAEPTNLQGLCLEGRGKKWEGIGSLPFRARARASRNSRARTPGSRGPPGPEPRGRVSRGASRLAGSLRQPKGQSDSPDGFRCLPTGASALRAARCVGPSTPGPVTAAPSLHLRRQGSRSFQEKSHACLACLARSKM